MIRPFLAALSATTLLAGCATTLGPFADVDANRDGGVSRDEAARSADLMSLYDSADDDRDGVLSQEEYELVRKVILGSRETPRRPPPRSNGGSGGGHSH
jgi:hypothetical protein